MILKCSYCKEELNNINLLYIAQFHETCGYSHAAIGYLKSLNNVIDFCSEDVNLKVLSVSLDVKKLEEEYHINGNKTSRETLSLINKYHFKNQQELDEFLDSDYKCLWHMTSVLPVIVKNHPLSFYFKGLVLDMEQAILGAQENYHLLAWETDKLCKEYESIIKNYKPEKVITPSEWNTKTVRKFINSEIVPHLIEKKTESIEEVKLPYTLEDKFVALSISEWTNRKNFKTLIRSFVLEFHDKKDAVLIIKTSLPPAMSKEMFVEQFSEIKNSTRTIADKNSNIFVILDYLSDDKMSYLYEKCDIFCLSSYGEGFSLPVSEAVSHERPVLCPRFGGHIDYLDTENPFFTDGMWETVFDNPPYDTDGKWYVTSVDSTRSKLRLAYEDWHHGSNTLNKSALKNSEKLNSGKFSMNSIGRSLLSNMSDTDGISSSTKTSELKKKIQNKTLKDQMAILENTYEGQDCYILNCGPSLKDHDRDKLNFFLKDKLVFTVKQAFERHKEVSDFHFFNCSNMPNPENPWAPYYENLKETISISSSNYEKYRRWSKIQSSDVFFKIPIRTEINNEFLVRTGKIGDCLIKNNLTRPCGPGIMYETVLFMALHLGVKSITCIGWDLTSEDVSLDDYEHFYGNTETLVNRGDILPWEIKETREFSGKFFDWCEHNNVSLRLASTKSALNDRIPRIKLEL